MATAADSSNRLARASIAGGEYAAQAAAIAPAIRAHADEGTQLRRLPDATWSEFVRHGFYRIMQPARWGGAEGDPGELYHTVREVARADGSAGWVLGVLGVHPWQVGLFSREFQEEIWGTERAAINSSSYAATGHAEKAPGGYRLSGRWSFSTGCDHCQWVVLGAVPGAVTVDGRELPELRSFMLPRKDYKIDDNWFVAGMAGTGSKDIVVEGAFVPEYRTQSHWDYALNRPLPGWELNPGPIYRLPFAAVFNYTLTAAVLGAAQGFLDEWIEATRTRRAGYGGMVRDDPFSQHLAADATYVIDAGIALLDDDCEELMDAARRGEFLDRRSRARIRHHACQSAQAAMAAIDRLFAASSGRAIFHGHPLQRRYFDLKGMLGHAFLNPDPPAKSFGGITFGIDVMDMML